MIVRGMYYVTCPSFRTINNIEHKTVLRGPHMYRMMMLVYIKEIQSWRRQTDRWTDEWTEGWAVHAYIHTYIQQKTGFKGRISQNSESKLLQQISQTVPLALLHFSETRLLAPCWETKTIHNFSNSPFIKVQTASKPYETQKSKFWGLGHWACEIWTRLKFVWKLDWSLFSIVTFYTV